MSHDWITKETSVFVTGAASGIGLAQAQLFLKQGARVFGVDQQPFPEKLTNQTLFTGYVGDISNVQTCEDAVALCKKQFGAIDILLNTAGKLDGYKTILDTENTLWHELLDTNLSSMFYLVKTILPGMIAEKSGTIINMASIAGMVAGGGGIAYTATKHAIIGFTKQLALDHANQGISVKAIAPGAIKTPMNQADFAGDGAMAQWVADETPVKRWASPEEVAELTLFLASPQASYLQGAVVPIDGGWTLK